MGMSMAGCFHLRLIVDFGFVGSYTRNYILGYNNLFGCVGKWLFFQVAERVSSSVSTQLSLIFHSSSNVFIVVF
jgi:hypothetical protein